MLDKWFLFGFVWLASSLACGGIGYVLGGKFRNQHVRGMILGAGLLVAGLPAIFALRDRRRTCRYCRQVIDDAAEECPHCDRRLPERGAAAGMMRLASKPVAVKLDS